MDLKDIKNVYFLGIGGIGMSAIARWFIENKFQLAGYDKTPTPLTDALVLEGATIHFQDDITLIPSHFLYNKNETLVIYTPAIPKDNIQFNYLKDNGFVLMKRSEVLGLLTQNMFTIAVAGTHGKTSTSSMVAHILKHNGKNVTAFLGGVTQNYGTNFLINQKPEDVICVVEADEFDRSFLTLFPDLAIVTSTDADHLDIYQNHSNLLDSFALFVKQIKPNGKLFQHFGLHLEEGLNVPTYEYSLEKGDYKIENLTIKNAEMVFDIVAPATRIDKCTLQIPGFHNAENALAAAAVCLELGLSVEKIKEGIGTFKGVKRRFEYHIRNEKIVYIDDYAHHPTEIEAFLKSVKALYPNKKITAVFQPHLYSRTRDFQEGFATSLSLADDVLLLDIYPARELPIEGVTSDIIFKNITSKNKVLCKKENVLEILQAKQPELLVTIGAGDIDTLVHKITSHFLC